jgi:hypothetical protein
VESVALKSEPGIRVRLPILPWHAYLPSCQLADSKSSPSASKDCLGARSQPAWASPWTWWAARLGYRDRRRDPANAWAFVANADQEEPYAPGEGDRRLDELMAEEGKKGMAALDYLALLPRGAKPPPPVQSKPGEASSNGTATS